MLFLDPYSMQVDWTTVEAIARTKAIDLWGLFPLGIGVNRLLTKSGDIPDYRNGLALTLQPHMLELPLRWKKPQTIFVNSMSDLFHDEVPLSYIRQVFDVMRRANPEWEHVYCAPIVAANTSMRPVEVKHIRRYDVDLVTHIEAHHALPNDQFHRRQCPPMSVAN